MDSLAHADFFGESRDNNPYWNETAWFSFCVPKQGINGFIYFAFRPNMGLLLGGPVMWDGTGSHSWDCLYWDWNHIQAIPPSAQKFDFTAPNSLTVKMLEPLKSYALKYDKNGFQADLTWSATSDPHEFPSTNEIQAAQRFHLEQCGRMRGTIVQDGTPYAIDCVSLRDTSYGPRTMGAVAAGSYFWGIKSDHDAFHVMAFGDGEEHRVIGGFLLRDGEMASLVSGTRRIIEHGTLGPTLVECEAKDSLGREMTARGQISSDLVFTGWPDIAITWSLLRWDYQEGTAWGDNQEFWPSRRFREISRSSGGRFNPP